MLSCYIYLFFNIFNIQSNFIYYEFIFYICMNSYNIEVQKSLNYQNNKDYLNILYI